MFDLNNRIKIDLENNRRSMGSRVVVVIGAALGVGLCLGVYFGLFIGKLVY